MSFNCQNCKKHVAQNIPQAAVVIETREKHYKSYFDGRYSIEGVLLASCTEQELKTLRCKETVGKEIVKQIACCPECELKLTGKCSYVPAADNNITHLPEKTRTTSNNIPVEYITIPERCRK